MEGYAKAIEASRLKPGEMATVEVGGDQVLLANVEGTILAMGATCTHEQWDLSEGALDGPRVTCAGHGAVWDLRTGRAEFDEELEGEPTYDVRIEGGDVYVKRK